MDLRAFFLFGCLDELRLGVVGLALMGEGEGITWRAGEFSGKKLWELDGLFRFTFEKLRREPSGVRDGEGVSAIESLCLFALMKGCTGAPAVN